MSTYEPQPVAPPDLEQILTAHLRSLNTRPGTLFDRTFPDALPVTISGTTYTAAVIVRDDGGPWPNRTVSVDVQGVRDAPYATVRQLAAWVVTQLSMLATKDGLPIASVDAIRGPMSVAENPPEFQTTADLLVVG